MSDGLEEHRTTTRFREVEAAKNLNELWAWAFECGVDPAKPEECPSCLAYVRASEMERSRRENLEVSEPPC